jgi:hypothetical protein
LRRPGPASTRQLPPWPSSAAGEQLWRAAALGAELHSSCKRSSRPVRANHLTESR